MPKPLIGITTERWSSSMEVRDRRIQGVITDYVESVQRAGGLPILIPLALDQADLQTIYARLNGVLIPGGGDIDPCEYQADPHPKVAGVDRDRDRIELTLTRQAIADQKPIFGICRGAQVFNVALGGTLYQDLPSERPGDIRHAHPFPEFPRDYLGHSVKVEEDSLLAHCVLRPMVQVNSRHHQSLREVAPGLEVVAYAPDGVIEAVELPTHPFALGVQWHPENLQQQQEMRGLFENFIRAAADRASN